MTPNPNNHLLAISLIALAMLMAPIMDGLAKWLATGYSPLQVTWLRFVVHFLVFLPFVVNRRGIPVLLSVHWPSQIARGLFLCAGVAAMFLALQHLPIAETLGIFFVSPLIVIALAPVVLKESVGLKHMISVGGGFIGTLLVMQPGFDSFHPAYLLPVAGGFCFAGYLLISRRMAGQSPVLVTHTLSGLVGVIALALPMLWVWNTPGDWQTWGLFIAIGVVGAISHGLVLWAYSRAEAALLAPFAYLEIVTGTAIGLLVFDEFPNQLAWCGIATIILSGLYIITRENHGQPG